MKINPSSPAKYRIRMYGHLGESWGSRLGGMTILHGGNVEGEEETILEGDVIDQADLFGVLKTIYDLRLPLLSVEFLGREGE